MDGKIPLNENHPFHNCTLCISGIFHVLSGIAPLTSHRDLTGCLPLSAVLLRCEAGLLPKRGREIPGVLVAGLDGNLGNGFVRVEKQP